MDWRILEGASRGFNQGVQNLVRIKQAGIELKQQQEKFEIDKKISNLQLQKYEQDLDPEVFQAKKKALSIQSKMNDLKFEEAEMAHGEAEKRAKMSIEEITNSIRTIKATNPDIDITFDPQKGMTFTTKKAVGNVITFPQMVDMKKKISDRMLTEGQDPTPDKVDAEYDAQVRAYSGGGNPLPAVDYGSAAPSYKTVDINSDPIVASGIVNGVEMGRTKSGAKAVKQGDKWLTR